MMNYKLDTHLITKMKELLLMNPDVDYFDKYFMPSFQALNGFI
jgi:hypothetical protein